MPNVCIIGGGYAGVHAARTARREGLDVTIVEPTGRHDLLTRLAAVAAGRRPAGDAYAPLEDVVDAAVVTSVATGVTPRDAAGGGPPRPIVHLEQGGQLPADSVVVTSGAVTWMPEIDGLRRSAAHVLRSAADALRLRALVPDQQSLVIVGGGATGVQLAGEVAHIHAGVDVHLVEATDRLLGSFATALGRHACTILRERGVRVHLSAEVAEADEGRIVLADGSRLDGLVVWTTGVIAEGNQLLPDAPQADGRLQVDRFLRVADGVLAAGDVAAHRDVFGRVTAPSAQIALQAGRAAGRNAALLARGRRPRRSPLVDLGWVVDLGGRGVAEVGPAELALPGLDLLIPVLHEAIDLRHLWQAGGAGAVVRHAGGRHRPSTAALRQAGGTHLRSVG